MTVISWLRLALIAGLFLMAKAENFPASVYTYQCKDSVDKGPIDLDLPAEYSGICLFDLGFSVGFTINAVLNASVIKASDSHLIYMAKFGSVIYRKEEFLIGRIDLISPSIHMVAF